MSSVCEPPKILYGYEVKPMRGGAHGKRLGTPEQPKKIIRYHTHRAPKGCVKEAINKMIPGKSYFATPKKAETFYSTARRMGVSLSVNQAGPHFAFVTRNTP